MIYSYEDMMAEGRLDAKRTFPGYVIIDAAGEVISEEPYKSEREAIKDLRVLKDHLTDVVRPLKVVRADSVKPLVLVAEGKQLRSLTEAASEAEAAKDAA